MEFSIEPFDSIDRIRAKDVYTEEDIALLRGLTETYPNEPELWDFLGDLMQICKSHYPIEESMDCYRRAIECDRTYAPAHESLGWALDTYFDEFEESTRNFLLALEYGSGDSCRLGLARVLAQTGKTDVAILQLNQCNDQTMSDVINLRREIEGGIWGR